MLTDKGCKSLLIDREIVGIITATLPNLTFKVKLDTGVNLIANSSANSSAKLRLKKIKLLVGDRVLVRR